MNDTGKLALRDSGIRWLWITALVIVVDQLSKFWIVSNLALYESIEALPVLNIYRTFNLGAAWSFLADAGGWQRWVFTALALAVSVVLVYWLRKLVLARHALLTGGLTLILGGAIGNLIDRVRLGHVVDFIQVHWGAAFFPSFNVADSAISIGAVFVVLDALLENRRERQAASSS